MIRFVLPLALTAAFWSGAAFAQATSEGADELTMLFQTYLGTTPGVIAVAPEGDTYGVRLDFTPLLAKADMTGATFLISPIIFTLTDNGNDTWYVTQDQSLSLVFNMPGVIDLSLHIANMKASGTLDEALQDFSEYTAQFTDISLSEAITDPARVDAKIEYRVVTSGMTYATVPGSEGGNDTTFEYTAADLTELITVPLLPFDLGGGSPPVSISLKAVEYTGNGTMKGFRPDAIYKLLAFFVANPSEAAIKAQQVELKTILGEAIPLFLHLAFITNLSKVTADTPLGLIALDKIGVEIEMSGIVEQGLFREAITMSGLALPEDLVPDWAEGLVPTDLSIDFSLLQFNLLAPAKALLSTLDSAKELPLDQPVPPFFITLLLPEGVAKASIAPGQASAPLFTLGYEGAMDIGPVAVPAGKATITMTGIDDVIAALQSAPPEVAAQAVSMIGMAKALAKPGDDGAMRWEVEMTSAGVLINGTNMGGGQ